MRASANLVKLTRVFTKRRGVDRGAEADDVRLDQCPRLGFRVLFPINTCICVQAALGLCCGMPTWKVQYVTDVGNLIPAIDLKLVHMELICCNGFTKARRHTARFASRNPRVSHVLSLGRHCG